MTPRLERLTMLCKQLNLPHLPTQIAHPDQMAAKREPGYGDFLEQALKDKAMDRLPIIDEMGFLPMGAISYGSCTRSSLPIWPIRRMLLAMGASINRCAVEVRAIVRLAASVCCNP